MKNYRLVLGWLLVMIGWNSRLAEAQAEPGEPNESIEWANAGQLHFSSDKGAQVKAPSVSIDASFNITGLVNRVTIKQVFKNPSNSWVEGIYTFPLPENTSVDAMKIMIGGREVIGEIRKRDEARHVYERAKEQGQKASLVEQKRPNMFTASVANVGPHETVRVEIRYLETVKYENGNFRVRLPLTMTPRYVPPALRSESNDDHIKPPFLLPSSTQEGIKATIQAKLHAGFPLEKVDSPSHQITSRKSNQTHLIRLQKSKVIANRDFILQWRPTVGNAPGAALFSEDWHDDTYLMMMVLPATNGRPPALPRELVFVIDTSGSMSGSSIEQAKHALRTGLSSLGPQDRFNVLEFNDAATSLFRESVEASYANKQTAISFVDSLEANGGTEILSALKLALRQRPDPQLVTQVVFLTDGSVGNEVEVFDHIEKHLGERRLFTIGIGSAPNDYFMTKAALFGGGTFTHIGDLAEVHEKIGMLLEKLRQPALTDIKIHWPHAVDISPSRMRDLYRGEPLVIFARSPKPIPSQTRISGKRGGHQWSMTVLASHTDAKQQVGLHQLWATHRVDEIDHGLYMHAKDDEHAVSLATSLAVAHGIVTKHTSLVAVDQSTSRKPGTPLSSKMVALNVPHGADYGMLPAGGAGTLFFCFLGLILLSIAFADRRWRQAVRTTK